MADLVKESRHYQMFGVYYDWHLKKTVDEMIADPIEVCTALRPIHTEAEAKPKVVCDVCGFSLIFIALTHFEKAPRVRHLRHG